ncbi:nucleoporin GLE1 isoform X2 [Sitophilus oryzae]|nr:nucleoporin GLE1 isoform X2 [Sitophilus oryzae]
MVNSDVNNVNKLPSREFWKIMDLQRQDKLLRDLNRRLQVFKQFDKSQLEQSQEKWLKTKQNILQDVEKNEANVLQANEQFEATQSAQDALFKQQTQSAISRIKARQEQLREKERLKKKVLENVNQIRANQAKFNSEWLEISKLLKGGPCITNVLVKSSKKIDADLFQTLPNEMASIIEKCKIKNGSAIDISDVQKSDEVKSKVIKFRELLQEAYAEYDNNIQATKANVPSNISGIEVSKNSVQTINEPELNLKIVECSESQTSDLEKLSKCIDMGDLQIYAEIMDFHDIFRQSFAQLEYDSTLKTFKFDLKKAINIPVNSLSGVTSDHIMDKYQKLHRLLSGQTVLIADKQINASKHPQGIAFCTDLLAKKFVIQGDLMVSSNPESAFCYASVILSLWNDFPNFGKVLLAYFYKFCPYLVPYYIPKEMGESDEDYYLKLGYQYNDGEVEKQDKFLKRMTGILKLYFAILISKPKRGQNISPHNLKNGWRWLASFLKLEPQIDITATALHVFLETAGFEMENRYGTVFHKVLKCILQIFMPKCQQVQCTGGAVTRLELLLTEYLKTKKFQKPHGFMDYAMW